MKKPRRISPLRHRNPVFEFRSNVKVIQFTTGTPLLTDSVDIDARINEKDGIIRDVAVITMGYAKGHNAKLHKDDKDRRLQIDDQTLVEMLECAKKSAQGIKVKVNHGTDIGSVSGKLINFHIKGNQLRADMVLMKTHANYKHTMETIRNLSTQIGLSTSFEPNDKPELNKDGDVKARCSKLLSVDLVDSPAANPNGLFSSKVDTQNLVMKTPPNGKNGRTAAADPDEIATLKARIHVLESERAADQGDDEDEDAEDDDDITDEADDLEGDEDADDEDDSEEGDYDDDATDEADDLEGDEGDVEGDDEQAYQDSYEREDAGLAREEARALSRNDRHTMVMLSMQRQTLRAQFDAGCAQRRVIALEEQILASGHRTIQLQQQEEFNSGLVQLQEKIETLAGLCQEKDAVIRAQRRELSTRHQDRVALSFDQQIQNTDFGTKVTNLAKSKGLSEGKAIELAVKEDPEAHNAYLRKIGVLPPLET